MKKFTFFLLILLLFSLAGCKQADTTAETAGDAPHTHQPAESPQTVENPVSGYCGNIETTLQFCDTFGQPTGEEYTFMSTPSVKLTDLLINLEYSPDKTCKCCDYDVMVTTMGEIYYVSFGEAYARCKTESGTLAQADLTTEQIQTIQTIAEELQK